MKWAVIILMLAVALSLAAMLFYFIVEGFRITQAEADARMGPTADKVCKEYKGCANCVDDAKHPGTQCGWCPAAEACIPRTGMYRLIPSWLTDIIRTDATKDCVAKDFVYNKGKCSDVVCETYNNCRDCAGALSCGWCPTTNTCLSKASMAAAGSAGSAGSAAGSAPCSISIVTESASCPLRECSTITDCATCTTTPGCGYCNSTAKCVSIENDQAKAGSTGSTGCLPKDITTQLFKCPCSSLTKCLDCANRPGCAYCTTSSKCVNLRSRDNLPDPADCSADGIAISSSQCSPGARCSPGRKPYDLYPGARCSPGQSLGNVISEDNLDRDLEPTDAELSAAQNNVLSGNPDWNSVTYAGARGAGSGPVSRSTSYTTVSGNGVVRPLGASSIPTTAVNSTGLGIAPLDAYVRMLVRSELASEGIPTIEPFGSSNEASAIGNATEYMMKHPNKRSEGGSVMPNPM